MYKLEFLCSPWGGGGRKMEKTSPQLAGAGQRLPPETRRGFLVCPGLCPACSVHSFYLPGICKNVSLRPDHIWYVYPYI